MHFAVRSYVKAEDMTTFNCARTWRLDVRTYTKDRDTRRHVRPYVSNMITCTEAQQTKSMEEMHKQATNTWIHQLCLPHVIRGLDLQQCYIAEKLLQSLDRFERMSDYNGFTIAVSPNHYIRIKPWSFKTGWQHGHILHHCSVMPGGHLGTKLMAGWTTAGTTSTTMFNGPYCWDYKHHHVQWSPHTCCVG
jgi:hypothetical protein